MLMIRTKVLRGENIEKVIKARLEKLFFLQVSVDRGHRVCQVLKQQFLE